MEERVRKYGLLGAGYRARVRKIGLMKAVYQNGVLKSEMLKQVKTNLWAYSEDGGPLTHNVVSQRSAGLCS